MIFEQTDEFKKDFKKLIRKYRSLNDDIITLKKIIDILPDERPPFSFRINNLGINTCVIKYKKIACKSIKGKGVNSGLRLIYVYFEKENKVVFIEIFHKSSKENEDRDRIKKYFK